MLTFQLHARKLADLYLVRLIEDPRILPEEACGICRLRVVLVHPISEETTYAVALHEIGHMASLFGLVRSLANDERPVKLAEEEAAWEWARKNALEWTPAMESVAQWALGTYKEKAVKSKPITRPTDPPVKWLIRRKYGSS